MTTLAVRESTLAKLKMVMKAKHTTSLDQTIVSLIESSKEIPQSMFGIDAQKRIHLTRWEHEEFQKERPWK